MSILKAWKNTAKTLVNSFFMRASYVICFWWGYKTFHLFQTVMLQVVNRWWKAIRLPSVYPSLNSTAAGWPKSSTIRTLVSSFSLFRGICIPDVYFFPNKIPKKERNIKSYHTQGHRVYYHRIVVESESREKESIVVKCGWMPHHPERHRSKRQGELSPDFQEDEYALTLKHI